ncbi:hypothetical protein ACFL96_16405 [Thermoproteota archaeon]
MGKIKNFFTNELIDQVLEAALALLAVGFGINYFLLADSWIDAVGAYAKSSGTAIASQEIGLMSKTISATFPFNYLTQTTFQHVFVIGLVMFMIGVVIKVITTESRAELVKDFGKIFIIPGVIGLISIIGVQLASASKLTSLFGSATLRTAESAVAQTHTGIFVWNMMGILFLIGILMLFFGYILSYTVKKLGGKPVILYLFGEFMVIMGWFTFAFYLIFRLLAVETLANALYGTTALKLFTLMWYLSKSGFIAAVCLFAAGVVLYKYGKKLERTLYGRDKPILTKLAKKTAGILDPETRYSIELNGMNGNNKKSHSFDDLEVRKVPPTAEKPREHKRPGSVAEYDSIFSKR